MCGFLTGTALSIAPLLLRRRRFCLAWVGFRSFRGAEKKNASATTAAVWRARPLLVAAQRTPSVPVRVTETVACTSPTCGPGRSWVHLSVGAGRGYGLPGQVQEGNRAGARDPWISALEPCSPRVLGGAKWIFIGFGRRGSRAAEVPVGTWLGAPGAREAV